MANEFERTSGPVTTTPEEEELKKKRVEKLKEMTDRVTVLKGYVSDIERKLSEKATADVKEFTFETSAGSRRVIANDIKSLIDLRNQYRRELCILQDEIKCFGQQTFGSIHIGFNR